jgi:YVTN family beta-propeller protein
VPVLLTTILTASAAAAASPKLPAPGPTAASAAPAATDRDAAPSPLHVTLWDGVQPVDPARLGRTPATSEPDGGPTALGIPILDISVEEDPDGDMPRELAWLPDGSAFVVVNRDTDNLTVHNPLTALATSVIPVGPAPVSVAVTPDGARAITANLFGDSVSVVDIASGTVEATIPVSGVQPFRVRITADGTRAVVAVINSGPDSILSIIDLTTLTETATVPSGGMGAIGFSFNVETTENKSFFTDFALTPANVAVTYSRADDLVRLIDLDTASVSAEIPVPAGPDSVDVSPLGDLAVVGCEGADFVTTIDLATEFIDEFWPVSDLTDRLIRFTPDGQEIVCWSGNFITFIDPDTGATLGSIDHGFFTVGDLEFTADGSTLLVGSANLRVIDLATRSLITSINVPGTEEIAAQPGGAGVIGLRNVFGQSLHRYRIAGSASSFQGAVPAGQPAEGDNPFSVAWTPDGSRLIVGNVVSGNATIVDPVAGSPLAWLEAGDRVREVRVSPDGTTAMVVASDANRVVFFNLADGTERGAVSIFSRPGPARFSPDGSEAYVLNIAGTDQVTWIDLSGPAPQIVAQRAAGQAGAANGPTFTEWSGMELSPDGGTIAVCDSFNDQIRIYDVAAREQVASLPTGDFPLRVAFGPNSDRAYVVNHFDDSLTVIQIDGTNSSVLGTVTGLGRFPVVVVPDEDDRHVYVGTRLSSGQGADALRVVDTLTLDVVASIPLSDGSVREAVLEAGGELLTATTGGTVTVFEPAGAGTFILGSVDLPASPRQIAFDPVTRSVAAAMPSVDAVTVIDLPGGTTPNPCPADVDDTGAVDFGDLLAILSAFGEPGGPADVDGSGTVDFGDLLATLGAWGPCPG